MIERQESNLFLPATSASFAEECDRRQTYAASVFLTRYALAFLRSHQPACVEESAPPAPEAPPFAKCHAIMTASARSGDRPSVALISGFRMIFVLSRRPAS